MKASWQGWGLGAGGCVGDYSTVSLCLVTKKVCGVFSKRILLPSKTYFTNSSDCRNLRTVLYYTGFSPLTARVQDAGPVNAACAV